MKYSTREITLIGLTAALLVAVGYVLFIVGSILPFPGSRFIIFSSFLSFMFTIPVIHIRKIGTISMISFIFGFIMSFITIFMGIAIIASGILTDIFTLIIFRKYNTKSKIIFSTPLYSLFSLLTTFVVSNYITGNKMFLMINSRFALIIISIIIYILGILGSYIAVKVLPKRIVAGNQYQNEYN